MLKTRLLTGLTALPIVALAVYLGGLWFLLGASFIALIAGWEWGQMMTAGGYKTTPLITLGLILLILVDSYNWPQSQLQTIVTLTLIPTLMWQLFRPHSDTATADWALTLMGGFYIGWGMGHLMALRQLADGLAWIWLALLSTWGADTFAYFVGKTWGRHKLWPRHSPKKTVEGFIGGIGGGILGAVIIKLIFPLTFQWLTIFIIGAIIPIVAFFGDICESMIKRDTGVKDSSNLFPGHGGFLDRIDSLLFVGVFVYYYAVWIG